MTLDEIYKYRFDLLCRIRRAEKKLNKLKYELYNNSDSICDSIMGDAIFGRCLVDAKEEYERWIEKRIKETFGKEKK